MNMIKRNRTGSKPLPDRKPGSAQLVSADIEFLIKYNLLDVLKEGEHDTWKEIIMK